MIGDWVIPAWLWAIPGIGLAGATFWFVSKRFGWKIGLGSAITIILAASYEAIKAAGAAQGIEAYRARQEEDNRHAVETADEARARANRANADPERLRDDDGFRRD